MALDFVENFVSFIPFPVDDNNDDDDRVSSFSVFCVVVS